MAAAVAFLGSCSAASVPGNSCSDSEQCERGTICAGGVCLEAGCSSDRDCEEGEACLQEGGRGQFSPGRDGVCTALECERDRDCSRGQVCRGGLCYQPDSSGPVSCTCNTDCPAGQGCFEGTCRVPLAVCSDDCQCLVGQTCVSGVCTDADPCANVTCGGDQVCVEGTCVPPAACDPACEPGETCVDGICQAGPGGTGGLCASCTGDADCGGADDQCVTITGAGGSILTYCGTGCEADGDCPSGFTCFEWTAGSRQCRPLAGSCEGCLATGCAPGQFCDTTTFSCAQLVPVCGRCATAAQCGAGNACVALTAAGNNCLRTCENASACGEGEACRPIGGTSVCAPLSGECGGTTPPPDPGSAACASCTATTDCSAGEQCLGRQCIVASETTCRRITDCPAGQICDGRDGINRCVQCVTTGDCATGQVCACGSCRACECPAGERCALDGSCVPAGDPSTCTSDSQCQNLATELGYAGSEPARCDGGPGGVGCYIPGVCNGAAGGLGGLPLPINLGGFGGTNDPFDAACPGGGTCTTDINILGGLTGGSLFGFACSCTPGDPNACRDGESCQEPLLPLGGGGPVCKPGGGGGLPVPFPFP
jgi:hypothetical protein